MSDDTHDLKALMASLSEVGALSASIIPIALRLARRKAKLVVPEACQATQEVAAHRLVALVLLTNGFLLLEQTTEKDKIEETLDENVRFAKMLLQVGKPVVPSGDDLPSTKWLSDEELKSMFSKECE
jgi:hypothetical protein